MKRYDPVSISLVEVAGGVFIHGARAVASFTAKSCWKECNADGEKYDY